MNFLRIQLFSLALAVVLGAFGAHALEKVLTPEQLHTWQTAVLYHFVHALGGVLLSIVSADRISKPHLFKRAQWLLLFGTLCFSGSLYLLSARHTVSFEFVRDWTPVLGPVTPFGGAMFIGGWILAALSVNSGKSVAH